MEERKNRAQSGLDFLQVPAMAGGGGWGGTGEGCGCQGLNVHVGSNSCPLKAGLRGNEGRTIMVIITGESKITAPQKLTLISIAPRPRFLSVWLRGNAAANWGEIKHTPDGSDTCVPG